MPNTFLTKEGYDKLQEELDYLRSTRRTEIAERLREAAFGEELVENAEYEAAKNEQAFIEGRIKDLEGLLSTARIIESPPKAEVVQLGAKVLIQESGSKESEQYFIVGPAEAHPIEGKISNESPLGKALMNHKVGDQVEVQAPDGSFKVKILEIA
ncbi:MAG TPA: transcription elongation factor GreA [Anaerolineaceae bacterium]|uniref:Transcription elongation factor GreA n=1 Tax=Anaerolinea thermophila TaxID=167964 RepID=A0A124FN18_9CHLR|nr:MAG: Transcription elongation factor GreA [Anaerolinea thermophila]HAF61052.1 transcription elongation factor GreA [Anaerolineaceae bacterium]